MKVKFMQSVDYWIGVPLCALLSLWHSAVCLFRRRCFPLPRKILFVELSEMGSAILAYASIIEAKRCSPDCEVFFLIFEKNRESVELLDVIPEENIIGVKDNTFWAFTVSALGALFKVRKLRIDTVLDLELFSRFTSIFSYLSGAGNRVGFHNYTNEGLFRGTFLTHRVLYNPHQHMSLNFLNLVLSLEAPSEECPLLKRDVRPHLLALPKHENSEEAKEKMWRLLQAAYEGITERDPLVILNPDPGVALPIRGWPLENFKELACRLLNDDSSLVIAILGLDRSQQYAHAIQEGAASRRCIDLTGKTSSLKDVIALFELGDVLVTNDSGPAHLASLSRIRSVVLFGPETPKLYGPLGSNVTTLEAGLSCSPCLSAANHRKTYCTDNKCLQAIGSDTVINVVRDALNLQGSKSP